LIKTAKLSGMDPQAWLADALVRLVNLWPNNRLDELLPWSGLPRVLLRATHEGALTYCSLADLKRFAVDLA
jgi:uncharacterized protein (DUF2237 family)